MVIVTNIIFTENTNTLISFIDEADNFTTTVLSQEFFEWVNDAETLINNFLRLLVVSLDQYTQDTLIQSMLLLLKNN